VNSTEGGRRGEGRESHREEKEKGVCRWCLFPFSFTQARGGGGEKREYPVNVLIFILDSIAKEKGERIFRKREGNNGSTKVHLLHYHQKRERKTSLPLLTKITITEKKKRKTLGTIEKRGGEINAGVDFLLHSRERKERRKKKKDPSVGNICLSSCAVSSP